MEVATEFTRAYCGSGFIGGYGLPDSLVEQLKRHRSSAHCAGCSQPIHESLRLQVRGVKTFHPSCALRFDAQTRAATRTATPEAPRVIGRLRGCALTFDPAGCHIINRDGSYEHEAFDLGVFDDSVRVGGQILSVGHDSPALRGSFTRLRVEARELVFDFALLDGAAERATLERVRRRDLRGCSIEFAPGARHWGRIVVHQRAKLIGIALTNKPQWFDTWVEAVSA